MTASGFVVLRSAFAGSSRDPNQFTVTHVTESSTQAEDAAADIPLALEYTPSVTTKLITVPEAGTIPMLIVGAVFLALVDRRRNSHASSRSA
jgi:hypothetical protein